jgi:hypothetical protein
VALAAIPHDGERVWPPLSVTTNGDQTLFVLGDGGQTLITIRDGDYGIFLIFLIENFILNLYISEICPHKLLQQLEAVDV